MSFLIFETSKRRNQETKKPGNQETKRPRNQETKKLSNSETNKLRNQETNQPRNPKPNNYFLFSFNGISTNPQHTDSHPIRTSPPLGGHE